MKKAALSIIISIVFLAFLFVVSQALFRLDASQKSMTCKSQIYKCIIAIHESQKLRDDNDFFPFFGNWDRTQEYWSWRAAMLIMDADKGFRFTEPWNSEYNLSLLQKNHEIGRLFCCPCDYPHQKLASYIAVSGDGTFLTEIQKNTINKDDPQYSDMIILIETIEPKNHWAEPGDNISPNDVIRMYEADPGLIKNSKQSFFSKEHYPKHFVTVIGTYHSFGEIKDVEDLRQRLIVPIEKF